MKFRIGEKVKFLNEVGDGEIISVIDKKTVLVKTSDGFELPVLETELISAGGEYKEQKIEDIQQKKISAEEPEEYKVDESYTAEDEEVVFALNAGKQKTDIMSYLVNSSTYHLYYVISLVKEGEDLLFSSGRLEPDTKIETGKLIPTTMGEEMKVNISVMFFGKDFFKHIRPADITLKIDPSDFYSGRALGENDYFEEDSAIFTIYSFKKKAEEGFGNLSFKGNLSELSELKEKKATVITPKKSQRHPEIEEIDLHIESIVDEFSRLSNSEIVDLQMGRFKTALETAIIHRSRRVVFIHGVGAGKLKQEIRRVLDKNFPDLRYQDASFQEYGYGATMVIIPQ